MVGALLVIAGFYLLLAIGAGVCDRWEKLEQRRIERAYPQGPRKW